MIVEKRKGVRTTSDYVVEMVFVGYISLTVFFDRIRSVPTGSDHRKLSESDHRNRSVPNVGKDRKCQYCAGFRRSDPIDFRSSEIVGFRQDPIQVLSHGVVHFSLMRFIQKIVL